MLSAAAASKKPRPACSNIESRAEEASPPPRRPGNLASEQVVSLAGGDQLVPGQGEGVPRSSSRRPGGDRILR